MITVTTKDFRANQSKYIKYAQEGKKVVLTSRQGDVVLTPIKTSEGKAFEQYIESKSFQALSKKVHKEFKEGKGVTLRTPEEIENYINSL